jgi:hypothetical protein
MCRLGVDDPPFGDDVGGCRVEKSLVLVLAKQICG